MKKLHKSVATEKNITPQVIQEKTTEVINKDIVKQLAPQINLENLGEGQFVIVSYGNKQMTVYKGGRHHESTATELRQYHGQ